MIECELFIELSSRSSVPESIFIYYQYIGNCAAEGGKEGREKKRDTHTITGSPKILVNASHQLRIMKQVEYDGDVDGEEERKRYGGGREGGREEERKR